MEPVSPGIIVVEQAKIVDFIESTVHEDIARMYVEVPRGSEDEDEDEDNDGGFPHGVMTSLLPDGTALVTLACDDINDLMQTVMASMDRVVMPLLSSDSEFSGKVMFAYVSPEPDRTVKRMISEMQSQIHLMAKENDLRAMNGELLTVSFEL